MEKLDDKLAGDPGERRRFVRVNDAVGLNVQRLTELPAAGHPLKPAGVTTVRKLDKYSIEGYADVRRDHPNVIQYINDLEERIRELLLDSDDVPSKPTHKVSLSVGGLLFSDKALLVPGEVVSIALSLFPSGKQIGTDAVIVSVNDENAVIESDKPSYRAEFLRLSDGDRVLIQAHVDQLLAKRMLLED